MMKRVIRNRAMLLAGLSALLAHGAPALAQGAPAAAAPAPSSNAMVNLVRLLVAQGTITRAKGDELIAEATAEAQQAQLAQQRPAQPAQQAQLAQQGAPLPPAAPGTIRVPYVPEVVRAQIRDELKQDVLAQAKAEGWAKPGEAAPDWVRGLRLYGDVRVRSQSNLYSSNNSDLIPNFAGIVAGGPRDLINDPLPLLNTTRDRPNQMRLRARLGAEFQVEPRLKVGVELATGNDSSPVTTNTTLGGGFAKRNIYLYKAFAEVRPTDWARVDLGRFDNPFLSTDALFDPDLRFDGVAGEVALGKLVGSDVNVTLHGGAFPLDFGDQNFPSTDQTKRGNPQKWLFAAQLEAGFDLPRGITARAGVGYYNYVNLQGRLSDPCALYLGVTQCSNDNRTPSFVQKGNSLSFTRQIVLDPTLPSGSVQAQPQLLGLTQDYDILDVIASVRVPVHGEVGFTLTGDYLRNLAFKRSNACRYGLFGQPVNNGGSGGSGNICDPDPTRRTRYVSGNDGFQLLASLGYEQPKRWGEWRVFGGYKYLQSDAVLDAFTDDDFHLGGTNAKGYILGGSTGLYKGMNLGARWLSANQISSDPLSIDVLQIDLNVAF